METDQTLHVDTPLGWIVLKANDAHLTCCGWAGKPGEQEGNAPSPLLEEARRQLEEYFRGERKAFDLPLQQSGTGFQQTVWNELKKIPYGERITYAELAKRAGNPKAFRAAGSANGKNKLFIIVPCHRVIQSGGKAGGFAYGTAMKQFLLDLEERYK
jgi:methylated-DNA-[protein]-cysteine S-methyltransferase